ncbi:COG4695 Phage-related protein [uncultured Caudovirales phage]|uniref:COG4695 Phage-related protein n=1 Tax=uncultured Caudovirales phage TaxID=2100421 RepID=A0A6J5KLN1_9CAUD|nr:COG4695 Phage-related protein [uncultured Caudovirales phage]
MNIFDKFLINLTEKRIDKLVGTAQMLPSTLRNGYLGNNPPPMYGDVVTWQGQNGVNQVKNGYCANDIVYSIIRLIEEKCKQAPWAEYEVIDAQKYKQYKGMLARPDLIQDWDKVAEIKDAALRLVKTPTKVTDLLLHPNDEDTWGDLIEQMVGFKLITGNTYVYGKKILAGKNVGMPNSLHIMPSQYMSIIANLNEFPINITGYQLYMQYIQMFDKEEILHDKYFNPEWSIIGLQLYGLSPLQAAAKVLTRSNEGKNASVAAYKNGGPKGVLFVDDQRYDGNVAVQEAMAVRKKLAQFQGSDQFNQVATSGYKMGFTPLGLSPVDLDLLNAENMDLRALCNVYQVPSQLLNDPDNKTFSNTKEGEKALTVRCAIPALASIRDQFNRKFQKDWNAKGRVIDFDTSVYTELQEGKLDTVTWLEKSCLTLERRYEILGEKVPDWMDEQTRRTILVPSSITTLDNIENPPINLPSGLNPYAKQPEAPKPAK